MTDIKRHLIPGLVGARHQAVAPSDSTDLAGGPAVIYVWVTGNVAIVDTEGVALIYQNAQAGTTLPTLAVRVKDTGTDADGLIAIY